VQADARPLSTTELYDRFRRPALSLARRILGDSVLAEDVLQDVFMHIWRNPGAFDPARGSFSTWVMTLVHHKAVDLVRHEQSQRSRRDRAQSTMATEPRRAVDIEDEVCDRAAAQRVRTALAALPTVQRQALALSYYNGFSQSEIAELTGTPLGTVKTRMRAGMGHLRSTLQEVATAIPGPPLVDASARPQVPGARGWIRPLS
jgi:RNA polymerase sigma-70 factor (ECF subfamily)